MGNNIRIQLALTMRESNDRPAEDWVVLLKRNDRAGNKNGRIQEFSCGAAGWGSSIVTTKAEAAVTGVCLIPDLGTFTCCGCGQKGKNGRIYRGGNWTS